MKISSLILAGMLLLGSGLSGVAMAHGDNHRGHSHGWSKFSQHDAHRHHRSQHHHRDHRATWRRDHRVYRPHYRHDYGNNRYGIHLFLGGR